MHYKHRYAAKGATTLSPRQLPVYPPDPEGLPEAHVGRLPPDWEESFVPYPRDPAGLQPFGKLLGLCHVALHVARCLFPPLHGFNTCSRAEMPLGDLPSDLVPRRRYEA